MNKYLDAHRARRAAKTAEPAEAEKPAATPAAPDAQPEQAVPPEPAPPPAPIEPPIAVEAVPVEPPVSTPERAAEVIVAELDIKASSNVRRAYLLSTGVLVVEFASGSYKFGNFTADLMAEWQAAKSLGSWFHQNVRLKPALHPVLEAPKK